MKVTHCRVKLLARHCWLIILIFGVISAAPVSDPVDLVRLGNEAFARGEFATALKLYDQAEVRFTDPGLVAFNKAAALYRLGRYREAEIQYLLCKEDASAERLPRVLFDLGNAVLKESQETDEPLLRRAIGLYEECLRLPDTPPDLAADARFNLNLSATLLLKARAARNERDPDKQNSGEKPGRNDDSKTTRAGQDPGPREPDNGNPRPKKNDHGEPGHEAAVGSSQPRPGAGNLPPIPDQDILVPLSPEDTAAYVHRSAYRILREHREHRQRGRTGMGRAVMDW